MQKVNDQQLITVVAILYLAFYAQAVLNIMIWSPQRGYEMVDHPGCLIFVETSLNQPRKSKKNILKPIKQLLNFVWIIKTNWNWETYETNMFELLNVGGVSKQRLISSFSCNY